MYKKTNLIFSKELFFGRITNYAEQAVLHENVSDVAWVNTCDGKPVYMKPNGSLDCCGYIVSEEWCREIVDLNERK